MLVPLSLNATAEDLKSSVKTVDDSKEETIAHYNEGSLVTLAIAHMSSGCSESVPQCNKWIRQANARIQSSTAKITPLYSIVTGKPIESFPETGYQITQLSRDECERILGLLCMNSKGKINDLRWRICMASGTTLGHDTIQALRIR